MANALGGLDLDTYTHNRFDLKAADGSLAIQSAAYRVALTRDDPLAFALVYLRRHLVGVTGEVTLSDAHLRWIEHATQWVDSPVVEPASDRTAEVAPRETGKSTWWFLILPLWAAAHGHISFAAAFADTTDQAEGHLASFKAELDENQILRADFPKLCAPKTRGRGTVAGDRVSFYHAASGFVFAARGIDSGSLGLKVGDKRPDLIILDDIEPDESRYSAKLALKRLGTLRDAILPLNIYAHVVMVGTVTMAGSIIHQLVQHANGVKETDDTAWIREERITPHHYPAIVTDDEGEPRSIWPGKWTLAFLNSIKHTRTYAKNYANDPLGRDGDYWTSDDFTRLAELAGVTRVLVSVDPNVTQKASSDFTGIAVVGWSPSLNKCVVLEARRVKKAPDALRLDVLATIERTGAGLVLVETNQGGDLWLKIFWGMPVNVKTKHQSEKKEIRAADVLNHYQRGRVVHVPGLDDLEGEMVAFPLAPNDDLVDAVGTGVRYFLTRSKAKVAPRAQTTTYAA